MPNSMPDWSLPNVTRRAALAAGAASVASLAGCAGLRDAVDDPPALERILLRSDTDAAEQLDLTLVYAPRDGSTRRPIWGSYEAPASGELRVLEDWEPAPGFYSLTAHAEAHDNLEVASINSHGGSVGTDAVQFEVVVKRSGDVWLNIDDVDDTVSIPGYEP